jgi:hypothetical protein
MQWVLTTDRYISQNAFLCELRNGCGAEMVKSAMDQIAFENKMNIHYMVINCL